MKFNENLKMWFLFVSALAVRLALIPHFNFCYDDAYITFRIARNLAQGYGMVFNPGEHVQATTTILYTLLMTPGYWLGIALPLWSKIINSLAMSLSIVLFYRILKGKVREGLIWFACLFLSFNYVVISQDLLGMEASAVILSLLAATYFYHMQRGWLLGFMLGILFLIRPEDMFAASLFWVFILIFKRRLFWKASIPLVIVAVFWFIFCLSFYGTLIPNTVSAKLALIATNPAPFFVNLYSVGRFLITYIAFAPLLILILPLGIWRVFAHAKDLLPIAIWTIVTVLSQLFSTFFLAPWYLAMDMPFLFLICIVGMEQLFHNILPGVGNFFKSRLVIVIVCLLIVGYEAFIYLAAQDAIHDLADADNLKSEVGRWFKEKKIPPNQVLAIEAIGRVGYESDIRILDICGLASPEMIPFIKVNDTSAESIIAHFHPDYFLITDEKLVNRVQGYKIAMQFIAKHRSRERKAPGKNIIIEKVK